MWKKTEMVVNRISVPRTITVQKSLLFEPSMFELPAVVRVSQIDFLYIFDRSCINGEVDEINIISTSDIKVMTFSHYMAQPKSMSCRKLVRNFIEEDFGDFDYNWLPNCFRHISTQVFYILNGDEIS